MSSVNSQYTFWQLAKYWTGSNPSPLISTSTGPVGYTVGQTIINRTPDPNWRDKVKRHKPAVNPYTHNGFEILKPASISCYDYNKATNTFGHNQMVWAGSNPSFSPVDDPAIADIALARLKFRLANDVKQFNSLVPLAELRELRGLIRSSASLATGLVDNLLKIRKKPRDVLRYASDAWLTFSFGISPMMNDAKNLAESIAAYNNRNDHTIRLTGSHKKRWTSGFGTTGGTTGTVNSQVWYDSNINHSLSYKYIAALSIPLKTANDYSYSDHFGLSFGQLPSTAWELVPYSWVIDYFTTAGAYLDDAFTAVPGSTIFVCRDRIYTADYTSHLTHRPNAGSTILSKKDDTARLKYFAFERQSLVALPGRSFRFKTLDEIGIHGVNKLLNLTSLLLK